MVDNSLGSYFKGEYYFGCLQGFKSFYLIELCWIKDDTIPTHNLLFAPLWFLKILHEKLAYWSQFPSEKWGFINSGYLCSIQQDCKRHTYKTGGIRKKERLKVCITRTATRQFTKDSYKMKENLHTTVHLASNSSLLEDSPNMK